MCFACLVILRKNAKERSSGQSLLLFFFKSFVAGGAHNEVKDKDIVSLGDVNNPLNERVLVGL